MNYYLCESRGWVIREVMDASSRRVDNSLRYWMHNLCESVGWIIIEVDNDVLSVGEF